MIGFFFFSFWRGKECLSSPFSEILSLFVDSGMKLSLNVSWADKLCVLPSRITQVMPRYKSYFSVSRQICLRVLSVHYLTHWFVPIEFGANRSVAGCKLVSQKRSGSFF